MDDGWFMEATCHDVGIAGNCGPDCPVYLRGECDSPPEPYVYVCVDAAGEPALTEGKRYELVEVTCDNLLLVADDEGQRREFFRSRFELQMGDFSESCDEAWQCHGDYADSRAGFRQGVPSGLGRGQEGVGEIQGSR